LPLLTIAPPAAKPTPAPIMMPVLAVIIPELLILPEKVEIASTPFRFDRPFVW